ncbi:MAG: hypoxanthine phosphoribosyltransferase, partial [bacterium]|nr:hypoxanthine phosphoribosyltransferase [bacterium]
DKFERRRVDCQADYIGRRIPDLFIIGYGMDYCQLYRNLPYIAVFKP